MFTYYLPQIVTNLPYGQRISPTALRHTFARFGQLLRTRKDLRRVVVLNSVPWFIDVTGMLNKRLRIVLLMDS